MVARRGKLPSFFKIIMDQEFCDKISIPIPFLQHFHGDVPHECHLQTAARTWILHLEVIDNKFYFVKGWNEFLQENGLEYRNLLVFHYAGNSHFHVDIFGNNTCGEMLVNAETESADEEEEYDDDASLDISDDSRVSSPLPQKKYKASLSAASVKNKAAFYSNSGMKSKIVKEKGGASSSHGFAKHDKWGARMRAAEFKSRCSSAFLVSMKTTYINRKFLWMPRDFTALVMPRIQNFGSAILRVSDRKDKIWKVKLTCDNACTKRYKIHGECWDQFMKDNKLKEGDTCAFRLVEHKRVGIDVVIFHTTEAAANTSFQDISDHENDEHDDESGDEEGSEAEEEGDGESENEDETEDEEEEEEKDDTSSDTHKRSKNCGISAVQTPRLSRDDSLLNVIARDKATKFNEESTRQGLDSFVVSLCSSYASGNYLSFPHTFVKKHMINQRPDYVSLCLARAVRRFCVKVNYIGNAIRLQRGWSEFTRVNDLKTGDVCVFVLTNANKFEFDIEVFRLTDCACTSSQGKKEGAEELLNSKVKTEIQID